MRGRNRHWDMWDESHLFRRDFRQDHGGGPEVPRHKKKARKKKRIKHDHIWYEYRRYDWLSSKTAVWVWEKCEICGKDRDRYED